MRRLTLMLFVPTVIRNTAKVHCHRRNMIGKSVADFWEIRKSMMINGDERLVSVIIRRMNGGRLHFFSVFDE